jgi:hypothetical protein
LARTLGDVFRPAWATQSVLRDTEAAAREFLRALGRGDEQRVARLLHPSARHGISAGLSIDTSLAIIGIDREGSRRLAEEFDRRLVFTRATVDRERVRYDLDSGRFRARQVQVVDLHGRWLVVPTRPEPRLAAFLRKAGWRSRPSAPR